MEVYLIRHGIAEERQDGLDHPERQLTKEGRKKTEKVAQRLKELQIGFDLVLTSPYARAQQTAQILTQVGLCPNVEICEYLAPDGNFGQWLENWWQRQEFGDNWRLALVGHEPDLSRWTEILVWGETKDHIVLKKAGMIGVEVPTTGSPVGRSQMFWLTPPRLLL
ncbi:phosphohistidine phosphatase SixA [Calothrix sp. NIES-3974]|uniref:phosphohistidine phosphatase SixA n=1 Tax=Calothrix sp. NIES-3974 TaxID=2005462 RepID=UPI000B61E633|nr:phosphohistidine phosphatase SixA [Calothrix sp. NIES-3974]BAZ04892.1 phosphohistidine phosphatase SixA [Calothrix sp. NIES-3974]